MLSKPIKNPISISNDICHISENVNIFKEIAIPISPILTYQKYYTDNINLKKYKLPELKVMVKAYNLARTGNKDVLISRIDTYFKKMKNSTFIQKRFRGWIVRYLLKLHGPAFHNKSICTNETDFVTMEPLDEIPSELFFSYTDRTDFTYGFNLLSLVQTMKMKGKIINPYNREGLDIKTMNNIISMYNITQILFAEHKSEKHIRLEVQVERNARPYPPPNNISSTIINNLSRHYFYPRTLQNVNIPRSQEETSIINDHYTQITLARVKSPDVRMRELFIRIDQLGNYSQYEWLSTLDKRNYITLYRALYDIWHYSGQLSFDVKTSICPLFDPFINVFTSPMHASVVTLEQIQFVCITVFENMIYSGINDEYCKLGALHALSALTIVSPGARNAMTWLYESLTY
jgi:hypothetical protein